MDATYTKKQGYAMLVKRWLDILKRMINGDEMKVIVEDVMYGQRYLLLRIEMSYT